MMIDLAETERDLLARLLDNAIGELRVEVRRTRAPEFHDRLVSEEKILKGLLARIRSD